MPAMLGVLRRAVNIACEAYTRFTATHPEDDIFAPAHWSGESERLNTRAETPLIGDHRQPALRLTWRCGCVTATHGACTAADLVWYDLTRCASHSREPKRVVSPPSGGSDGLPG